MILPPSTSLDKNSPIPLYHQIKQILVRYIAECEEGDLFPGENQLCELFSVSRPTVRQAIASLVQEGLVERTAGKGSFITATRIRRDYRMTFQTFDHEIQDSGRLPHTEILGLERLDSVETTSVQLGISENAEIYLLRRLRSADGSPLTLLHNYLPADLLPNLEDHRDKLTALRRTMEEVYHLPLTRVTRRFEALSADSEKAKILKIPSAAPIQYIETHVYLTNGRCVEYSEAWYRGDRASFFMEIKKDNLDDA